MNIKTIIQENYKILIAFAVGAGLAILLYPTANIETKAYERSKSEYTKQLKEVTEKFEVENYKIQKNYQEEINVMKAEHSKIESDLKQKISSLNTEISTTKKQQHIEVIKITRPDGTIEERTVTNTSEDSINQRIIDMKKETEQHVKSEITKMQEEFAKRRAQIIEENNKVVASLQKKIENQQIKIDELLKKETQVTVNPKTVGVEAGIVSDLLYRFGANYNFMGPVYIGLQMDTDAKTKVRPGLTLGVRF